MKALIVVLAFAVGASVYAETISKGDVTAELGPVFFIDEAAIGGGDQTTAIANFDRVFSGISAGLNGNEITVSGIGWASSASGTTATQATVTVTYLGLDGVFGGEDDVVIGVATDALLFSGAGEYYWRFDNPMQATIDGSNTVFRININTGGSGTIRYKTAAGVKLSVAGSATALNPFNLALYRDVTASSNPDFARYATDGVVGNDFKWIRDPAASLPQTLDISFPGPVEIGSYHLYSGANNGNLCRAWRLQYRLDGSPWADVPGSAVSNNNLSERSVVFDPIIVDELRLLITANEGDGRPRVREWAVFPPNGGVGYPFGTGVTLNMAQDGLTTASTNAFAQYPRLATDGYLGTHWMSGSTGPNLLEITLRDEIQIGSAHLYSGDGAALGVLSDFDLEYSNDEGATWLPVPGGSVVGNTNADLVVSFSAPVAAGMVRLTSTNAGPVAVRELCVFPDNELGGYPIHADVVHGVPPLQTYEAYSDSFYRIRSESVNLVLVAGTALVASNALNQAQVYQVLLNVGTDTYRIFNRSSRKCLAIQNASLAAGAETVEEIYRAFPSQQWRIAPASGGAVYLENVFSRLRLEVVGDAIVQMPRDAAATQRWHIDFLRSYPKKGMDGNAALADDMGASWWYGWTAKDVPDLNTNLVDAIPMQWGGGNLDPDSYQTGQLPITVRFPDWLSRGYSMMLLGFNEPDGAEQANMTVGTAIAKWPQLMASGLPLGSPVAVGWTKPWMSDWMAEAMSRGYPIDYLAMHTYPGPNAASIDSNVSDFSAAYGNRPVLLTEFGFVDWNNTSNWSENLLYNQMIELLWRLEANPDCKRYSLFGFVENDDYPQPADPTGRMRRSNWMNADGSFTSIGEVYMGWDGDITPNGDQPYILHNRNGNMRVGNNGTTIDAVNVRTDDASAQVIFQTIGNGYYYIVSALDGKRLRRTSTTSVDWAPATTTVSAAEWSWSMVDNGWYLISNRLGGNLRYTAAAGITLSTAITDYQQWFFVPPMTPVDNLAPKGTDGLVATPAHKQVSLDWTGSISEDTASYRVKRSTTPGGPYLTVASNVVAFSFVDTGLENGTNYYYVVDTVDRSGLSGSSVEVMATPQAPPPDSYANWQLSAFEGAAPGTDLGEFGNPDGDANVNLVEYALLLNPLVDDAAEVGIAPDGSNGIQIRFQMNRHATDIDWSLLCSEDLVDAGSWTSCTYTVASQTNIGDRVEYVLQLDEPLPDNACYRIKLEK